MDNDLSEVPALQEKLPAKSGGLKRIVFLAFSGIGIALFSVAGIWIFAFQVVPLIVPLESYQVVVATNLADSLTVPTRPKDSIAGAPSSTINPFVRNLENRDFSYRWKEGDTFAYEFSFQLGDKGPNTYKVNGDCQYTIGKETLVKNDRLGTGTAFAIAPGYLATCAHVVKTANRMEITFGSQRYGARIIDIDALNDLAILTIDGQVEPLPLSNSATLELAESVLVVGYPLSDVIGSGIKVSAGIVSGIDDKQAGQAIAIDGAINPGNSGGPVLNQKGHVVGIASATLQGDRINPVGFASPVDCLRALMAKNKIEIPSAKTATVIESKEIAKRVAPSVGLIEVSGWADNRCSEMSYIAKYSGSTQSPVVIVNGVRKDGVRGKLTVSRLGEVKNTNNAEQLPFVMESVAELIFQPFDLIAKDQWNQHQIYDLRLQPSRSQFGGMFSSPLRDRLFGREREEPQPGIQAQLDLQYRVIDADESAIRVKKSRQFRTLDQKQNPSIEVSGDGNWEFDLQRGIPISLEENLTVISRANGQKTEMPIVIKVSKVDSEVVEERQRLAKEATEKQKAEQQAEQSQPNPQLVDELITQSESKETSVAWPALSRLSKIAIVESKREAVLSAIRKLIAQNNSFLNDPAWNVYSYWSTPSCAPELRRVIAKSSEHREAALNALLKLKQEEDVPLLLKNIRKLSRDPDKILLSFGSKIESEVLDQIAATNDVFALSSLLDLLREIGTEVSLTRLKEMRTNAERGNQIRMDSTIRLIEQRLK